VQFYAPQPPEFIKRQKEEARKLRKSNWWNQKLQEGICYYCGGKFEKEFLTMDHKVAIARGGMSSKSNIVVCCKDCNSKKQSLNSVDFVSI
jgi:5-methylcytosine-specific restriction endonuclease McrA